ncbi:MAG: type II toxin-antitoxin system VapC family toxin [Rhizobiales bacterium]|jgi:predicted nucleic acid-binding protein|nr:type II toxin-antitoxin system VapC family toxin [Hyphomicrobiales bacterium]
MTLVDTNVILDVLTRDSKWLEWSVEQLHHRRDIGQLSINEIGYAEIAVRMSSEAELQFALNELSIVLDRTPTPALFLAGKTFQRYRRAGGPRVAILPDFFIGAHAQTARLAILTRDARRYRTYFPNVELITPEA